MTAVPSDILAAHRVIDLAVDRVFKPSDPHWVDFQSVSLDVCRYPPTAFVSCGNN
jgi:hypothetical protein